MVARFALFFNPHLWYNIKILMKIANLHKKLCIKSWLPIQGSSRSGRMVFVASSDEDRALNLDELETDNLVKIGQNHIAPTPEGGFNGLSGDQLLDYRILGTRRSLQKWNGAILNRSYGEALRRRMKHNVAFEQMRGIRHRYTVPRGFFARTRHFLRLTFGGAVSIRLDEHYGGAESVELAQAKAALNVLEPLSPHQRALAQNWLANHGVPLPPAPAVLPKIFRGKALLLVRQTLQLANAPLNTIEYMRSQLRIGRALIFPPAPSDIFRPEIERTPENPIEYLIDSKKLHGELLERQNSTVINEPRRLGAFLKDLKDHHAEIYDLMVNILEDHSFDTLTKNNSALRLLRYIETRLALRSDEDVLKADLKYIIDNLPNLPDGQKDTKTVENEEAQQKGELEKLIEQIDKFSATRQLLADNYQMAVNLGNQIFDANKNLQAAMARGVKDYSGLIKVVDSKEAEKTTLLKEILALESALLKEAKTLHMMLERKDRRAILGSPIILEFIDKFIANPPAKSVPAEIFGNTNGLSTAYIPPLFNANFSGRILREYRDDKINALKQEIEIKFKNKFKKSTKLNCFELHVALRERDAERKGTFTSGERRVEAVAAVMMDEAKAMLIEVDRSANREQQEWLGSGALSRFKKRLKARFGIGGMQTAKSIIDHVSGFDRDFAMFRGMRKDITEEELINLIDTKGGISDAKLFEFQLKLTEVFNGFEMLHHKGKVELFDLDAYDMQQLLHVISKVRAVLWTRTGFESIANKNGNPAENTLLMLREKRKKTEEETKAIMEKIAGKGAEWKSYFDIHFLKQKFFDLLEGKWLEKKKKKMSAQEFEEALTNDGMLTVYDTFKNLLVAKEIYDITAAIAKKVGTVLASGGKGLSHLGAGLVGRPYKAVAKPLGSSISKGLKWSIGNAKYLVFPLVLAGGILGAAWALSKEPWLSAKTSSGSGSASAHH